MERKRSKEKTPLSIDRSVKAHGSISLGKACSFNGDGYSSINSSIDTHKTKSCEDEMVDKKPMSGLRKTFFLLSFNVWILYFAAFLWLIPCRHKVCTLEKVWTMSLSNIDITSNLELGQDHQENRFFAFSYTNRSDLYPYLTAFESEKGAILWTATLPFVAKGLQCNFFKGSDHCTVIGNNAIASYNYNGTLNWYAPEVATNLDNLSSETMEISCTKNLSLTLYAKKNNVDDVFLCSLDNSTGVLYSCTFLPCDQLPIQMIYYSEIDKVLTSCWRGTKINAWMLPLDLLCSVDNSAIIISEETMKHLHMIHSWHSTFETIPGKSKNTLVVTSKELRLMSGHRPFATLWKATFNKDSVVQAIRGNFGYGRNDDIMLALNDKKGNSKLKILNFENGREIASLEIPERIPISLSSISKEPGETAIDLALLRTEIKVDKNSTKSNLEWKNNTAEGQYTFPSSSVSYFIVGHDGSGISLTNVFNSSNIKSTAIAIRSKSQTTVIIKDVIEGTVIFSSYSLKSEEKDCKM